jgi:hypothetical protein
MEERLKSSVACQSVLIFLTGLPSMSSMVAVVTSSFVTAFTEVVALFVSLLSMDKITTIVAVAGPKGRVLKLSFVESSEVTVIGPKRLEFPAHVGVIPVLKLALPLDQL